MKALLLCYRERLGPESFARLPFLGHWDLYVHVPQKAVGVRMTNP